MHRVSALLSWDKRKSAPKLPNPLNRLSTSSITTTKVNKEVFWPGALDQECEKAARILKSFCADGCLAPLHQDDPTSSEPKSPLKITKRIPKRIIQNAAGIAVFTCMRSGLWMTGSGGSGILIARKADGTWSPPSALLLHTPSLSFMGVDIYDCVLIVNNLSALESLVQPQVTLGDDVGLTCGPMVPHGSLEEEIKWKDLGNTVFTYMKARGQAQVVNLSGCLLAERGNENERFYGANVTMMDILAGNVAKNVDETRPLFEVIKQAEGRSDYDTVIVDQISLHCAPGDAVIESPKATPPVSPRTPFGVPSPDDPDPFGFLALEMAGLEIREAGTRLRPTSNQFEGSCLSVRTENTHTTDACTQTETSTTPHTTPSLTHSDDGRDRASMEKMRGLEDVIEEEVDYTKIDFSPIRQFSNHHSLDGMTMIESPASTDDDQRTDRTSRRNSPRNSTRSERPDDATRAANVPLPIEAEEDEGDYADDEDDETDDDDDEEPVIFEVASAVQPVRTAVVAAQVQAKGAIAKSDFGDVSGLMSPARSSFASDERVSIASEPILSARDQPSIEVSQATPVESQANPVRDIPTPVSIDSDDNASFKSLADTQTTEVGEEGGEQTTKTVDVEEIAEMDLGTQTPSIEIKAIEDYQTVKLIKVAEVVKLSPLPQETAPTTEPTPSLS
ncbi:unnamed protein product [Parascedosporium putredinis]|uniref:Ysc84 actin-binding domain-containing protein n=1 Tax=Parascedosporium putredinis TaxID=1442378 RepID=A0A9P1GTZ9_9PEZI|nr:unnamed protein product [Parascedosporium putredinis]CAI7987607.1 unnamed protein product [Parascedosporium putredinis]